jgi:hypothetical protein
MNTCLLIGAILSFIAAFAHIGCIVFGASWYRFFGAGEQMARMSEAGSWIPALTTSMIVLVLLIWSLYAFAGAGAGVIKVLPFTKLILCIITAIYLLRGVVFYPLMNHFPDNSLQFWLISSGIFLFIGLMHLVGLVQVWNKL